ncbi:ribbon-helix-helix protein, CopG family [Photorhabdus antumapuensis]|uniref:ribbon-helix-helix protein, CopG family n=1 Tax=Photorhabdus antumapuensis TaxID=2862867 RepID=UPI001CED7B33|nr:ribbon-helix-helix protein, CopG family [Photorhabdus antumapuensis]
MVAMVRINIDLPEETIRKLEILKERSPDKSRAAQIRKAIDAYLDANISEQNNSVFGLWGDKKSDGLEYQNNLRKEWQ